MYLLHLIDTYSFSFGCGHPDNEPICDRSEIWPSLFHEQTDLARFALLDVAPVEALLMELQGWLHGSEFRN